MRETLLQRFTELPQLKFETPVDSVESYSFPHLTQTSHGQTDIGAGGHSSISSAALAYPRKYPAGLETLYSCLDRASSRFRYASASTTEWDRFFRYSEDRLFLDNLSGNYRIENKFTGTEWLPNVVINSSKSVADSWFSFLLQNLNIGDFDHRFFIVGDPGCGKSSFIKFLLNRHFDRTRSDGLIFSRFEFYKFKLQFSEGQDRQTALEDYLSFIHLRDLLISMFYDLHDLSEFRLRHEFVEAARSASSMPEKLRNSCSLLEDIIYEDAKLFNVMMRSHLGLELAFALFEHQRNRVSLKNILRSLSLAERAVMIFSITKELGYPKCVTVFDGLDHVRYEDAINSDENSQLIIKILRNRNGLSNYTILRDKGVMLPRASIVVMRENTLNYLLQAFDFKFPTTRFVVGRINSRVATFNAIKRGVFHYTEASGIIQSDALDSKLMRGIEFALQILMLSRVKRIKKLRSLEEPFAIFSSNLRELLNFLDHYFKWTIDEMIILKYFSSHDLNDAESLLSILTSREASHFLRHKRYRLIELLILPRSYGERVFQNCCTQVRFRPLVDGRAMKFKDNSSRAGLFDNIFNYHRFSHSANPDRHFILEKVRVLQVLNGSSQTWSKTIEIMRSEFGYFFEDDDFLKVIIILMMNDLVSTTAEESIDGEPIIFATRKGQFLLNYLITNMTYLEHIFHKTLMPTKLIDFINDQPRGADVEAWTIGAIRNVFILLTYLNYVERNNASGKKVPSNSRIVPMMTESIKCTVAAIIRRSEGRQRFIAISAEKEIEKVVVRWKHRGLLA